MIEAATLFIEVLVLAGLVATWTLLRGNIKDHDARLDALEGRKYD